MGPMDVRQMHNPVASSTTTTTSTLHTLLFALLVARTVCEGAHLKVIRKVIILASCNTRRVRSFCLI